jgi:S1-C subfamily serine protease
VARMDLTEAIESVRPSVVQIALFSPTANPNRVVAGTGFWVSSTGLVMTAWHVVNDARQAIANSPEYKLALGQATPNISSPQLNMRGNFNILDCDVVQEDQRHDIALLQAKPNPFDSEQRPFVKTPKPETDIYPLLGVAALATSAVEDGERIAVSGYPLSETVLITTSGSVASAFGTDIKQANMPGGPAGFTMPDIADIYLADVAVNPGNSGGPFYRVSDGQVIGVCVSFRVGQGAVGTNNFLYNSGLSVIVPIKYGGELMAKSAI